MPRVFNFNYTKTEIFEFIASYVGLREIGWLRNQLVIRYGYTNDEAESVIINVANALKKYNSNWDKCNGIRTLMIIALSSLVGGLGLFCITIFWIPDTWWRMWTFELLSIAAITYGTIYLPIESVMWLVHKIKMGKKPISFIKVPSPGPNPCIYYNDQSLKKDPSDSQTQYALSTAKLNLPDGSVLNLSHSTQILGRQDFEKITGPGLSRHVSREHISTKQENGSFFIMDKGSVNGTKINGLEIKDKGWQELKDGDRISIAGVLDLTYKAQ